MAYKYHLMFMAAPAALGYIKMVELHDYVQFYLVVILFFVLWFYINILLDFGDFNAKQEPTFAIERAYTHVTARKVAHIGWLEVVWTIIPIFILTAIAIPSFKLLYALDVVNAPLVTLRCIGNQWYWTYECDLTKPAIQDTLDFYFDQQHFIKINYITQDDIAAPQPHVINNMESISGINTVTKPVPVQQSFTFIFGLGTAQAPADIDTDDLVSSLQSLIKLKSQYAWLTAMKDTDYAEYLSKVTDKTLFSDTFQKIKPLTLLDTAFENSMDIHTVKSALMTPIASLVKLATHAQNAADSFAIDSYMLDADELQLGAFRLLEVDNYPKLPADAEIRIAVTGTDVIHSYAVPSLGIKIDAIPGRLNQFGIRVRSPGTYYGQCSELCGVGHGFMPIKIQFIKFIK